MPKIVNHEERRQEIAKVTAEVISKLGADEVKLTDIAAAIGWTTGVLTHYFDSKEEILLSAARLVNQRLLDRVESITINGPDDLLSVAIEALPIDDLRLTEWRAWLSFWGKAVTDSALGIEIRTHFDQWTDLSQQIFRNGIKQGLFNEDIDPNVEADKWLALIDGIGLQAALNPEVWPAERQVRPIQDYIHGLVAKNSDKRKTAD